MNRIERMTALALVTALVCMPVLQLRAQSRNASGTKRSAGAMQQAASASRPAQSEREAAIRGFAAARVAGQRELEAKLKQAPTGESAEKHLRFLTAEPHLAGTPGSKRVAEYVRDQLRSYGFEAELVRYDVWLPHPKEVKLEIQAPERIELARPEEAVEGDPSSGDARAVMGYNGYAPSAEVIAPVVYANYGLPEDYERLRDAGVSVKGKLVLVRYGRTFRGVKTYVAEENKAAGVIIYSDPADDGYVVGDPYPRGPWRPMSGIQRGSVYYGFLTPGDPLTPGVAATADATRLEPKNARTLPQIPTIPISARDAEEILKRLNGPRVPRLWQGGLPFSYHMGGGSTLRLRMKLDMDYQRRAIWNAVGTLRGTNADQWVVVGNHHDAWVFGAVDPSSGTTAVLEMARSLGILAKSGWKPRRSIVICAWDAEEFGLIGSTEWVEHRVEELRQKAVVYINVDSAVSGDRFGASGTPSLKGLVREAAREVTDPRSGRSVYEVWNERTARADALRDAPGADREEGATPVGNLGSGSDFTPFFHHAGVPSLDLGFGGEYGVYHSIYDSFAWMKKFGDPEFAYHVAAARLAGVLVLRLAEADVLPHDYDAYATEIARFVEELQSVVGREGDHPELDLRAVAESATAFRAAAARAMKMARSAAEEGDAARTATVNAALREAEQALLSPQGLTGRPWYRHTVFAPGTYQGYGVVLLPGVREAVERGDWPTARAEATALAEALRRAASRLEAIE